MRLASTWVGPLITARRQRLLGEFDALRTDHDAAWRSGGIDVLVCAAHALPALRHGQSGTLGPANAGSYATLFDVTGHPAGADAALTREGAMYTLENLLHFLHMLSAIVWFGGVLALNVLAVRVGRGPDRAVQASLLGLSDRYGRSVIAPAGAVTLVTGLLLVWQQDLPWSTLWVEWGLIGLVVSVALGATLIRATNAELLTLLAKSVVVCMGEWGPLSGVDG